MNLIVAGENISKENGRAEQFYNVSVISSNVWTNGNEPFNCEPFGIEQLQSEANPRFAWRRTLGLRGGEPSIHSQANPPCLKRRRFLFETQPFVSGEANPLFVWRRTLSSHGGEPSRMRKKTKKPLVPGAEFKKEISLIKVVR